MHLSSAVIANRIPEMPQVHFHQPEQKRIGIVIWKFSLSGSKPATCTVEMAGSSPKTETHHSTTVAVWTALLPLEGMENIQEVL